VKGWEQGLFFSLAEIFKNTTLSHVLKTPFPPLLIILSFYSSRDSSFSMAHYSSYHKALLAWYAGAGRDLPWRRTRDPYRILISEMMLQQTQVERVLPKYEEFLRLFPTTEDLARADRATVLRAWSGLGYNSRALRLKGIAEEVVSTYGGVFPRTKEALLSLKGIGPYTAGAILCFAFEERVSFIDTNIQRILHRVFVGPEHEGWKRTAKEMEHLAAEALPKDSYHYHQALMDLGSSLCTARKMSCAVCPLSKLCVTAHAIKTQPELLLVPRKTYKKKTIAFKDSARYVRGGVVEYLRRKPHGEGATYEELFTFVETHRRPMKEGELEGILADLVKEELVRKKGRGYVL
jgi:A/G-specific adenine glycosylase